MTPKKEKSIFDLDHFLVKGENDNDPYKKTDSNIQEISYSLIIEESKKDPALIDLK